MADGYSSQEYYQLLKRLDYIRDRFNIEHDYYFNHEPKDTEQEFEQRKELRRRLLDLEDYLEGLIDRL